MQRRQVLSDIEFSSQSCSFNLLLVQRGHGESHNKGASLLKGEAKAIQGYVSSAKSEH